MTVSIVRRYTDISPHHRKRRAVCWRWTRTAKAFWVSSKTRHHTHCSIVSLVCIPLSLFTNLSLCIHCAICIAPTVSQGEDVNRVGPRFTGMKRTRGSFLKQTPSSLRRNSSLTPNTVSSTATPTPVGVSTGRGFVFQKGVAKPSTGGDQVSTTMRIPCTHTRTVRLS